MEMRFNDFKWDQKTIRKVSLNAKSFEIFNLTLLIREAFKKKSLTFLHWGRGGQDRSSLHFFFQKHGLKWLNIALLKLFFLDFRYTFWKIGGGSDPSVKNVTLFFLMKASLNI